MTLWPALHPHTFEGEGYNFMGQMNVISSDFHLQSEKRVESVAAPGAREVTLLPTLWLNTSGKAKSIQRRERERQAKRGTCGVMQHCTVTHGHTQSSADTHSLNLMTNRWDLLPVSSTCSTSCLPHGEKWNRFSASDTPLIRQLWSFLRSSAAWLLHTETHIFMKKIQGRFICVLQSELSPKTSKAFSARWKRCEPA